MIDPSQRERVLGHYPMLRELSDRALDDLLASTTRMKVPAGAIMFDEDQPCMGFPLLLAGTARVIKASANGRELHLYDVGPGEACILTSNCLLDAARYQARGVAKQDLELAVMPPATFHALMASAESFRSFVLKRFSERMAELLQLVSAVTFQKLDQRLAGVLAARPSPIRTTHQQLADELGSLREIVSRLLKGFEERGWVRLGREQIEVLDAPALRKLAEQ